MTLWEPYAEELVLGRPLPPAPSITIGEGLAWQYQAVCGDALRLPLSHPLASAVTGTQSLANPGLVLQVAIGQSTVATRRVIANLFYRDVRLLRQVPLGTTITTTVTPTAAALARPNSAGARAKVLLSITTTDQDGAVVADFERLALIPVRDPDAFEPGGETGAAEAAAGLEPFADVIPSGWSLHALGNGTLPQVGKTQTDPLAEPVDDALALVRLTQNLAAAHRDARRGQQGRRLVYGGHTIGLAQAALSRADSAIATVLGWRSCDHLAPVFEGDLLSFDVTLEAAEPLEHGTLAAYRVEAAAHRDGIEAPVLSWRPVVWTAATPSPIEGDRR